jgi:hypothetical protein
MNILIHSLLLFCIPMVVLIVAKQFQWKHWKRYLITFLLILWGNWFFSDKAHADDYNYSHRTQIKIDEFWQNYYPDRALTSKTRVKYIANVNYHTEKAWEEFSLAKEKCWFLPNISTREKLNKAWVIFMIQVPMGTPLHKAIVVLIGLLTEYGSACIDEWFDIQELLESAQTNAEMAKFYQDLLGND